MINIVLKEELIEANYQLIQKKLREKDSEYFKEFDENFELAHQNLSNKFDQFHLVNLNSVVFWTYFNFDSYHEKIRIRYWVGKESPTIDILYVNFELSSRSFSKYEIDEEITQKTLLIYSQQVCDKINDQSNSSRRINYL